MIYPIPMSIKITVNTNYEGAYLKKFKIEHAFSYTITIENLSTDKVQLVSRHWEIVDSLGDKIVVDGEGVVGQKPVLLAGEKLALFFPYENGDVNELSNDIIFMDKNEPK